MKIKFTFKKFRQDSRIRVVKELLPMKGVAYAFEEECAKEIDILLLETMREFSAKGNYYLESLKIENL